VLRKVFVEQGIDMPVNATLAVITAPNEPITEADLKTLETEKEEKKEELVETLEVKAETLSNAEERVLASPAAKRLAREHGVNLAQVKGTGPEGRIVEDDVQEFIQQANQTAPHVKEIIPLTGIKKTTAERVSTSFRTAPHSTVIMEVDMTNASKLRNKKQISYTELLVKAVAEALMKHPLLNSTLVEDEKIKVYEDINVGVAVATEQGLVIPVIHNADKKSPEEIASKLRELAQKARKSALAKEDVSGGTFTITNLGMYDVDLFLPIINPPEAAILSVGKIVYKPVAEGKEIVVKPMITLGLAYDHRIVDGAPAAQFLHEIKKTLETITM
jgi:pyruvate dehydrogenase E2 component (dihydrolipoamide acetyltransferase)